MNPNRIELEQGSAAWVAWREDGIGGSDAPVIMFDSLDGSPFNLWQQKVKVRAAKKDNKFMARGRKIETVIRDAYTAQTGNLVPPGCFEHPAFPHLRCSLDGGFPIDAPSLIVELKGPEFISTHLTAREGQVPNQYYAQVQHSLMVTGAEMAHYGSFWHGELVIVEVKPDDDYIGMLMTAEQEFWSRVVDGEWPAPSGVKDMEKNEEWAAAVKRYIDSEELFQHYAQRVAAAKADLARMVGMNNAKGSGCGVEAAWSHTVRAAEKNPRGPIDSWSMSVRQIPKERVD